MKKQSKANPKHRFITGALIFGVVVIFATLVSVILAMTGVITKDAFKVIFCIFTLGIGAVFFIYGLITNGGYELAVGGILLIIGLTVLLIGVAKWYWIVLLDIVLLILVLAFLFLQKSDKLYVEKTDEKPGYKSFQEKMDERHAKEAEEEKEPLPEIKNYSNKQ